MVRRDDRDARALEPDLDVAAGGGLERPMPRSTGARAVTMIRAGPRLEVGHRLLADDPGDEDAVGADPVDAAPPVVSPCVYKRRLLAVLFEDDLDRARNARARAPSPRLRAAWRCRRTCRAWRSRSPGRRPAGDDIGSAGRARGAEDERPDEKSHRSRFFQKRAPTPRYRLPMAGGRPVDGLTGSWRLGNIGRFQFRPVPVSSRGQDTWFSATGPGFESRKRYQLSIPRLLSDL